MTSKFTLKSLLPILCILPLIFVLSIYIVLVFDKTKTLPPLNGLPLILLLTFTLAWLFFGEFRTKMIKVKIEDDCLIIKKFGGLSPEKKYLFSEIDGLKTSILRSRGGAYEYLYFMQGDKKIGKISEFYHKNYSDMKEYLKTKLKELGYEKFSFIDELKESFT